MPLDGLSAALVLAGLALGLLPPLGVLILVLVEGTPGGRHSARPGAWTALAWGSALSLPTLLLLVQIPGLPGAELSRWPLLPASAIWLGVALFLLVPMLARHLASGWLVAQAQACSSPVPPAWLGLLDRLAGELGMPRCPRMLCSELAPGPAAAGIRHPVILLPPSLGQLLAPADLAQVLAHELAHHRGEDLLRHRLLDILCCVTWFNPLVWLARHRAVRQSEYLADWYSLQLAEPGRSWQDQARVLLGVLQWQQSRPALATSRQMVRSRRELDRRLVRLARMGQRDPRNGKARSACLPRGFRLRLCTGFFCALVPSLTWPVVAAVQVPELASSLAPGKPGTRAPNQGTAPLAPEELYDPNVLSRYLDAAIDTMDWDRAETAARILEKRNPGDPALTILLARLALRRQDWASARQWIGGINSLSPTALNLVARSWDYQGERQLALEHYRKAAGLKAWDGIHEAEQKVITFGLDRPLEFRKAGPPALMPDQPVSDRHDWTCSSSEPPFRARPELAIDGNVRSRFGNYIPMHPNMYLEVDFGRVLQLSRAWLVDDAGGDTIFPFDYPRIWTLELRNPAGLWTGLAREDGEPDRYAGLALEEAIPCTAIRFGQLGSTGGEPWSVYEVEVREAVLED